MLLSVDESKFADKVSLILRVKRTTAQEVGIYFPPNSTIGLTIVFPLFIIHPLLGK